MEEDKILHSWNITGHEERERTTRFYILFLCACIILILFAVWQKNFLFGMFVLLSAGTIIFLSGQRSEVFEFSFTETHFVIGDHESEYTYDSVNYFDMYAFSDTDRELFIVFKEKFRPMLRVRYYKVDENIIEDILIDKKVQRKKIEPSLIDIFSKIIGI